MIGWIGIALFVIGLVAVIWIYMSEDHYSGDAGIALVIPALMGWAAMGVGLLLALIGLGIWIYHHVQFH